MSRAATVPTSLKSAFVTSLIAAALVSWYGAPPPPGPTTITAVPNLVHLWIEVAWDDVAGETGYQVYRKVDGGAEQLVSQPGADVVVFKDQNLNAAKEYEYRVTAMSAAGESASSPSVQQNFKIVWPVPASHDILHAWNDTIGNAGVGDGHNTVGFHAGVDIQRNGANNKVVAARGGLVTQADDGPDGGVIVKVLVGDAVEYDGYNHFGAGVPVAVGESVKGGQEIGKIDDSGVFTDSTGAVSHFVEHTHFNHFKPTTFKILERHPLKLFSSDDDKDPKKNAPAFRNHAGTPAGTLLIQQQGAASGTYLTYDDTHPAHGDIDLILEIGDEQGPSLDQAPVKIAWWIEPPAEVEGVGSIGVKTLKKAYVLYDWEDRYFGTNQTDRSLHDKVVDAAQDHGDNITSGAENYPWENLKHFILTNAFDIKGTRDDVREDQCWNTNAKDDEESPNVLWANYAGQADTTKPAAARFKDGTYRLHVIATDLVNQDVDLTQSIRIENFPPIVAKTGPKPNLKPAAGTSLNSFVVFSEPMDTSVDPKTLITVNNNATVKNEAWSGDRKLTFTLDQLVRGKKYKVTVSRNAKDKPGTPGGNQLDGDRDGTAGDDHTFVILFD